LERNKRHRGGAYGLGLLWTTGRLDHPIATDRDIRFSADPGDTTAQIDRDGVLSLMLSEDLSAAVYVLIRLVAWRLADLG
jgi:hypothetical protein